MWKKCLRKRDGKLYSKNLLMPAATNPASCLRIKGIKIMILNQLRELFKPAVSFLMFLLFKLPDNYTLTTFGYLLVCAIVMSLKWLGAVFVFLAMLVFCSIGTVVIILNELFLWIFIQKPHWDRYRVTIWNSLYF